MDLEKLISELKSALIEKKFGESAVASLTAQFAEAIKQKDQEYKSQIEAERKAKEDAANQLTQVQASLNTVQTELAEARASLKRIEDERAQASALALTNSRVESLDNEYELDDEDRKLIISEISGLDETAFASYRQKFSRVWQHKSKEFIKASRDAIEAKVKELVEARVKEEVAKASQDGKGKGEADLDEAMEKAKASNTAPDSQPSNEKSVREKYATAFSKENVIVTYSK